MGRRKGSEKQANNDARKSKLGENDVLAMFHQFQDEVRNEIEGFKVLFADLTAKLIEKENIIEELQEQKALLTSRLDEKEKEAQKSLKVCDHLERKVCDMEGGFILSGRDMNEIIIDKESVEFNHFVDKFREKLLEFHGPKRPDSFVKKSLNFSFVRTGNSNNFLTKIDTSDTSDWERKEIEKYISKIIRPQWNGVFEWKGEDGKKRKVYIKKNRSFIDRKISKLMFEVFKNTEQTTGKEVEKEWRNGKLLLNGNLVNIERSFTAVKAYIKGTKVAEVHLE